MTTTEKFTALYEQATGINGIYSELIFYCSNETLEDLRQEAIVNTLALLEQHPDMEIPDYVFSKPSSCYGFPVVASRYLGINEDPMLVDVTTGRIWNISPSD